MKNVMRLTDNGAGDQSALDMFARHPFPGLPGAPGNDSPRAPSIEGVEISRTRASTAADAALLLLWGISDEHNRRR